MLGDKLYLSCECAGEGRQDLNGMSLALGLDVVCCPTDYANFTSKIFLGGCFEMIIFITTVEPHLLAILVTQPHRFYGHFILTQTKAQLVLFIYRTPLIWP